MELIDYITVGYLVILFLVTAYFRRDPDPRAGGSGDRYSGRHPEEN